MSLFVDIKKKYGKFELNVSFETTNNNIFAILGSSGCGKSLTLKCIAGIEKPDYGTIILDGKTLFDSKNKINLPPQQRKIGYLFQNYALFPNMSVIDNISFGIDKSKSDYKNFVSNIISSFSINGLENLFPHQLSGGQQQRVALARIFASEPDVILLDEPFSALDSSLKWFVEEEIRDRLNNFSGDIIFVSHNRGEVYRLAQTVAMIDNGLMQKQCETKKLFNNPNTLSALQLTGCKNVSSVSKISNNSVFADNWGIKLSSITNVDDDVKHVGIRAHNTKLENLPIGENSFKCTVNHIVEDIENYIVVVDISSIPNNKLTAILPKEYFNAVNLSDNLYVSLPPQHLIFLDE